MANLDVWVEDDQFAVSADITIDDPLPAPAAAGNQRYLLDLPTVTTADLGECIATIHRYTTTLCANEHILDNIN